MPSGRWWLVLDKNNHLLGLFYHSHVKEAQSVAIQRSEKIYSHRPLFKCWAHHCFGRILYLFIVLTLGLPIGPPLNVIVVVSPNGGVVLAWEPPQTDSKLLGYKINYGNTQDPPTMAARESTNIKTEYFWVRPDIFLEYGEEVMVVVWAYSLHDEGAGLSVVVSPAGLLGKCMVKLN